MTIGASGYWWYRRRYLTNRPETLSDRYAPSETGASGGEDIFRVGYINSPEMPRVRKMHFINSIQSFSPVRLLFVACLWIVEKEKEGHSTRLCSVLIVYWRTAHVFNFVSLGWSLFYCTPTGQFGRDVFTGQWFVPHQLGSNDYSNILDWIDKTHETIKITIKNRQKQRQSLHLHSLIHHRKNINPRVRE